MEGGYLTFIHSSNAPKWTINKDWLRSKNKIKFTSVYLYPYLDHPDFKFDED